MSQPLEVEAVETKSHHTDQDTTIGPVFWEARTSTTIKNEKAIKKNFTRWPQNNEYLQKYEVVQQTFRKEQNRFTAKTYFHLL